MKIALIGYGKMGHAIERIATERGHSIVLSITASNREDFTPERLSEADVAIEFTAPQAALHNVMHCIKAGIPTVCGTTGWNAEMPEARAFAQEAGVGLIIASNFSVGVNIFFEINSRLATLMAAQPNYRAVITEMHHLQKKDKPSGTAITLAEDILKHGGAQRSWHLEGEEGADNSLPVTALREDGVPGTHTVSWTSEVDTIEIRHIAHSRDGFALGAVLAAEFIAGRKGVFTMRDVLGM